VRGRGLKVKEILDEAGCIRLRIQHYGNSIVFVPTNSDAGEIQEVEIVELGRGERDSNKPYPLAFVVLPRAGKTPPTDVGGSLTDVGGSLTR